MLLIITNKSDLASDYLILKLQDLGIPFKRLNTEDYPASVAIDICFRDNRHNFLIRFSDGSQITQDDLSSVYFRQPITPSFENIEDDATRQFVENEFTELLRSLWRVIPEKLWLNHPRKLWLASNKVEQLMEAARVGFSVPDTLISHSKDSLESLLVEKGSDLVVKAVRHGFIRVKDRILLAGTQRLPQRFLQDFGCYTSVPMTYQEEIKNSSDVRVVVVGDEIFPAEIILDRKEFVDWRISDIEGRDLRYVPITLPSDIREYCVEIVKRFGLRYSSIDLMRDAQGAYYFLELNPNGQWAWIEQLTEYKIRDSIVRNLVDHVLQ